MSDISDKLANNLTLTDSDIRAIDLSKTKPLLSIKAGDAPVIAFFDPGTKNKDVIGKLWIKNGRLIFEGNADESARLFFQALGQFSITEE